MRERERYLDTRRVFLSSRLVWGGANVAAGIPIAAVSPHVGSQSERTPRTPRAARPVCPVRLGLRNAAVRGPGRGKEQHRVHWTLNPLHFELCLCGMLLFRPRVDCGTLVVPCSPTGRKRLQKSRSRWSIRW